MMINDIDKWMALLTVGCRAYDYKKTEANHIHVLTKNRNDTLIILRTEMDCRHHYFCFHQPT